MEDGTDQITTVITIMVAMVMATIGDMVTMADKEDSHILKIKFVALSDSISVDFTFTTKSIKLEKRRNLSWLSCLVL